MRNLKLLGLVLAAVSVMSGVAASSASADQFTAESFPAMLTGVTEPEGDQVILTTAGSVNCKQHHFEFELTGIIAVVLARLKYVFGSTQCTTSGLPTEIETNECSYQYNLEGGASTTGDMDIVCPAGKEITIKAGSGTYRCIIHIKAQNDVGGTVTYAAVGFGATREITVSSNVSGLDYTHTKGSGLGACTGGSATNGTLTSKVIFTGEKTGGGHVGVFLN